MIRCMLHIHIFLHHRQIIITGLYANITGHITNNAALNFDDDKHTSHELFHIAFEIYNPDPLMSRNFHIYG